MLRYRFAPKARIKRQKERILPKIEVLKSQNNALEAKISDLESKQGVSITQDEISDLKAENEVEKDRHKELG
ncbi:hypothetical protein T36_1317 [Helicobacter cinaedi]|uniref:hypothetical protein n=1 Tax=Helicobacter cinaedi TaxID=213 RepID=UPI001F3DF10C|nr:hypothetical protein [Helicobacter cinaedi]BDB64860.1 hypothetical protein T36_1317 [Helicobacter cinaedi]